MTPMDVVVGAGSGMGAAVARALVGRGRRLLLADRDEGAAAAVAAELAGEVEEGSWYVVTSESGDAFRGDTSGLRRDVMRRQPGMLAWHANRPVDPDLN